MSAIQDSAYTLDSDRSIWVPSGGTAAFNYSDGLSVEDYLHRVVLEAKDIRTGSDELRASIRDWPSLCHLSPSRANLLRPLAHLLTGDVLEMGCGCGALTRYLGEVGTNIIAVEGSPKRAAITAARCRDLENVTVVCDHFNSLRLNQRFDCVLLVGVLEYCQMFESGHQPALELLSRCKRFLKPGGRVIIAIENRYGLKYFSGAPEDHLGLPYVGIESRYEQYSPITWSRMELLEMMQGAGFSEVMEFYPFPDYKLPRVVFSKGALEYGRDIKDLLSSYGPTQHSAVAYTPNFSEASTWPGLLEAKLVPELSNSFLFVGSDSLQQKVEGAFYYSTERRRAFQHQIIFRFDGTKLRAERARLFDEPTFSDEVCWKLTSAEFEPGIVYATHGERILNRRDWTIDELASWAGAFHRFLVLRSQPGLAGARLLDGADIDCIPINMIVREDGSIHCFDREFSCMGPLPLNYVLFRGIMVALGRIGSVAPTHHVEDLKVLSITRSVLGKLGILLSDQDVSEFLEREAEFHFAVLGVRPRHESFALQQVKPRSFPAEDNQRKDLARQLYRASTENTKLSLELLAAHQIIEECRRDQQELARASSAFQSASEQSHRLYQEERAIRLSLERSKSWRLTEPLRSLAKHVRGH
ncbi:MAG: hypothetical protein JWP08_4154 [Bryobacterales bacterium]|nr:hypothetical protein [Bryobacterales bacterium]